MFRSFKITSLTLCLLAASVLVNSPLAHAGQSKQSSVVTAADGMRFQVVQFGDLDLSAQAGNRALYARIRTAAKRVCAETASPLWAHQIVAGRCQRAAVANAVAAIGNGRLTAVHLAQSSHSISST
jgi:UrcA family protein